jgi:hypothetical protein
MEQHQKYFWLCKTKKSLLSSLLVMPASQQNGHDFDEEIKNIHAVGKTSYTAKHDIPAECNGDVPLSVKSSVGDGCDSGDALRMYDNAELSCYQVLRGQFEQVGGQKHLRQLHLVDMSKSTALLFGANTRDDLVALDTLTKSYRPGREDIHRAVHAMKNTLNARSGYMQFRPKMDSQQHRLQCSIPKWSAFVAEHPERVLYHSTAGIYRGVQLTLVRDSLRRIRQARC